MIPGIDISPERRLQEDGLVDGYNNAIISASGSSTRSGNQPQQQQQQPLVLHRSQHRGHDHYDDDDDYDALEPQPLVAAVDGEQMAKQLQDLQGRILRAKEEYQDELRKWKTEKEQLQANIHKSEVNDPQVRRVVETRDANRRELEATQDELQELSDIRAQVARELEENDVYALYAHQYCEAANRAQDELSSTLLQSLQNEIRQNNNNSGDRDDGKFLLNRIRRMLGQDSIRVRDERNGLVERMRTVEESNERLRTAVDEEQRRTHELHYLLDKHAL